MDATLFSVGLDLIYTRVGRSAVTGVVMLLGLSTALWGQGPFRAAPPPEEVCIVQLVSGQEFEACVANIELDTVELETFTGQTLKLPLDLVAHGIFDVPSQGTWRPRLDQRQDWSLRLLLDLNASRAEYSSEELRGGTQLKVAVVHRLTDRLLLGPTVGVSAYRAFQHETVAPVGLNMAYKLTPRISAVSDLGYGFGLRTSPSVTKANGGLHFHPRVTVKGAHPYNQFNIEFGFGYVYQRASFERFQNARFLGETVLSPGLPGRIRIDVPYHRFSLNFTCTFW